MEIFIFRLPRDSHGSRRAHLRRDCATWEDVYYRYYLGAPVAAKPQIVGYIVAPCGLRRQLLVEHDVQDGIAPILLTWGRRPIAKLSGKIEEPWNLSLGRTFLRIMHSQSQSIPLVQSNLHLLSSSTCPSDHQFNCRLRGM
mmetsp:Transcript_448/g.1570  ORF Transcript_448/g.1570 Transcript_448/m.1570 type:complete len:141 (-) Transcript_448:168-590(-)